MHVGPEKSAATHETENGLAHFRPVFRRSECNPRRKRQSPSRHLVPPLTWIIDKAMTIGEMPRGSCCSGMLVRTHKGVQYDANPPAVRE
jgi:hypothetical protein